MREALVEDVMSRRVVTAREQTPFKYLIRLMRDHRISGLPVTDDQKRLIGIVTESDLLSVDGRPAPRGMFLEWFIHPSRLSEIEERSADLRAGDVMTREVVSVSPDTTVRRATKTLLEAGVKRLPVVDEDGYVVGIVSRRDLLSPYLRPDEDIRREIVAGLILRTMWMDPDDIDVRVQSGVVTVEGRVDRRSEKDILLELVHRVDGVVAVRDQLTFERDDRDIRVPAGNGGPRWSENWVAQRP